MSDDKFQHAKLESGPGSHFKLTIGGVEVPPIIKEVTFRVAWDAEPRMTIILDDAVLNAECPWRIPVHQLRRLAAAAGYELVESETEDDGDPPPRS